MAEKSLKKEEEVKIRDEIETKKNKGDFQKFLRMLAKQVLFDPSKSMLRQSKTFSGNYTKDNIISWLQAPTANEKNLRNASIFLYMSSMHYRRLIDYYAGLPLWSYVISPLNFNPQKVSAKPEAIEKQFMKVSNLLEVMNLQDEMRKMVLVALREGAFYGVRWLDSTSSFVQKLNADNCVITSISDGVFLFSYDMSTVQESSLECFPPEFVEMRNEYLRTGEKWQPVPADISVCIKEDPTTPEYTIPPFSAVMPSLFTIAHAESVQEVSEEISNYKMIAGTIPVDDDGNPKLDWDLAMQYYRHIANAVGDNVGVAISPFELKDFKFDQAAGVAEVDTIARSVQNFWSTAGTSALLHGAVNSTAGVTKLAIKNDETLVFSLMKQCERVLNRYLKTQVTGAYKFKVTFLPITVFNRDEYISKYREAITYGIGKSYYVASLGIPQGDIVGLDYIEDNILGIDERLTPLRSSNTMPASESESAGRQALSDDELGDAGEATRDSGANENR